MKNLWRTMSLALVSFALVAGCGGGSSSSYKNSLTFGTGLGGNGFDLIAEGSTFSVAAISGTLYFKLEGVQWLIYRWADVKDDPDLVTWGWARLNPSLPHQGG